MFRANESVSVLDYTISLNSEILDRSRVNKLSEMGCRSRLIEAAPVNTSGDVASFMLILKSSILEVSSLEQ